MKKLYLAYVVRDQLFYFEKDLQEREDKIKVVKCFPAITEKGEVVTGYILEAEEGTINSKYEIEQTEEKGLSE